MPKAVVLEKGAAGEIGYPHVTFQLTRTAEAHRFPPGLSSWKFQDLPHESRSSSFAL